MKPKEIIREKNEITRRTFNRIGLGERRARNDPVLQEKWVRRTLKEHGIENLFSDVVIVTPENAYKYVHEYDRRERDILKSKYELHQSKIIIVKKK